MLGNYYYYTDDGYNEILPGGRIIDVKKNRRGKINHSYLKDKLYIVEPVHKNEYVLKKGLSFKEKLAFAFDNCFTTRQASSIARHLCKIIRPSEVDPVSSIVFNKKTKTKLGRYIVKHLNRLRSYKMSLSDHDIENIQSRFNQAAMTFVFKWFEGDDAVKVYKDCDDSLRSCMTGEDAYKTKKVFNNTNVKLLCCFSSADCSMSNILSRCIVYFNDDGTVFKSRIYHNADVKILIDDFLKSYNPVNYCQCTIKHNAGDMLPYVDVVALERIDSQTIKFVYPVTDSAVWQDTTCGTDMTVLERCEYCDCSGVEEYGSMVLCLDCQENHIIYEGETWHVEDCVDVDGDLVPRNVCVMTEGGDYILARDAIDTYWGTYHKNDVVLDYSVKYIPDCDAYKIEAGPYAGKYAHQDELTDAFEGKILKRYGLDSVDGVILEENAVDTELGTYHKDNVVRLDTGEYYPVEHVILRDGVLYKENVCT